MRASTRRSRAHERGQERTSSRHGARPRMGASLRRAFEDFREDLDQRAGDRLGQIGIPDEEAEVVANELYDLSRTAGRTGPSVRGGDGRGPAPHADGKDPDGKDLLDVLVALPEGQRATFLAMVDMALALAAAEGMMIGGSYVASEVRGRRTRGRNAHAVDRLSEVAPGARPCTHLPTNGGPDGPDPEPARLLEPRDRAGAP